MFNNFLHELKNRTNEIYKNDKLSPEEKDLLMIKMDWEAVGNDLLLIEENNFNIHKGKHQ